MVILEKIKKIIILIGFIITICSTFFEEMSSAFGVYNICFWIYMVFDLDFNSKIKKELMSIEQALKDKTEIVVRQGWMFIHYFFRICLFVLITYLLIARDFSENSLLWHSIYIILLIVQIISIFLDFPIIKDRYYLVKKLEKRKK